MKGKGMEKPLYVLGIDLGTSHSALSYWCKGEAEISQLEIEQISSPGQRCKNSILPSVVYLPHAGELAKDDLAMPWGEVPEIQDFYCVGKWARDRGSQVPERTISSAKSWLCNRLVNRSEKILPWGSSIGSKMSPVEALTLYLAHLKNCFLFEKRHEELSLNSLQLILTVPASFDELARNLTHEAAKNAGFHTVTLLEEPQAAFYSWIARNEKDWKSLVKPGELVLVCDVGGGTTDLSLIAVKEQGGDLELVRLSVGEHLLLGGDNMDLSLAYFLKAKLKKQGHKIDKWQISSLVSQARSGKETLLKDPSLKETVISIAGKGSSLMASALSTSLTCQELQVHLLDGFFPLTELGEHPKKRCNSGFQELGLEYESDPAISKHLSQFLHRSWENCASNPDFSEILKDYDGPKDLKALLPTTVLFNGGVFKSPLLRERIMKLLSKWYPGPAVKEIQGDFLDLAVAHGAGYYGRSKATGHGIRIASGIARSYYIGLESASMAVPGVEPEVKGFCVAAQGTEEGTHISLPKMQFGLITGEEVSFRFFSSAVRAGDKAGMIVEDASESLDETTSLRVQLPALDGQQGQLVPVSLGAMVSEMGTLQLSMQHLNSEKKWDLEFNVRPQY
ncbi:MAG: Hsp70 family protein [Oligoflexales bacterium]